MKRARHTPERIVNKLREADTMLAVGRAMVQVVQALGVSEQTFGRWVGHSPVMAAPHCLQTRDAHFCAASGVGVSCSGNKPGNTRAPRRCRTRTAPARQR